MRLLRILALVLSFSAMATSEAQVPESKDNPVNPAPSITEFKDKTITPRIYIEIPSYSIQIQSKVSGNSVTWKPAVRTYTGVDVSFPNFFLGGGGAWANNDNPGAASQYGTTNYSDYRLGATFKWFHGEAFYETYSGFYVDNSAAVDPVHYSNTSIKLQDANLTANNLTVNGTFIMHPEKFSYAAAIGQNERQEAWGGSLLLGFIFSETAYQTNNYLIPGPYQNTYGQDSGIKNAQFYNLAAKVGYGYTFVWGKTMFISLLGNVGLGAEYRTYGDGVNQTQAGGSATVLDALISLGYNGDTMLAAIVFTGLDTTYTTASLNIPQVIGDVKIAIGGHF